MKNAFKEAANFAAAVRDGIMDDVRSGSVAGYFAVGAPVFIAASAVGAVPFVAGLAGIAAGEAVGRRAGKKTFKTIRSWHKPK